LMLLLLIHGASVAEGRTQTVDSLLEQASAAEAREDYQRAAELYLSAQAKTGGELALFYAAARDLVLAGETDRAFDVLGRALDAGMVLHEFFERDTVFLELPLSDDWVSLRERARVQAESLDEDLRRELTSLAKADQANRAGLPRVFAEHGHDSPEADSALAAMTAADDPIQKRLREIIEELGWPPRSLVGDDGSHAAWLLVQHSDSVYQRRVLPALAEAVQRGEARGADLAYLTDRVRQNMGLPQLYGTQVQWSDELETWEPYPIEDPEGVEGRRKEVGLEPLSEYLVRLRSIFQSGGT